MALKACSCVSLVFLVAVAPKETVSVRFVARHRSALNGQTIRVRGVIAAAILGDAACTPNRGTCMQSSIILADCKQGHHRLTSSIRVFGARGH
jgi:hypothetical protein